MSRRQKIDPVLHQHLFAVRDRSEPELDRCSCGTFRFEIMGPVGRYHARRRAAARLEAASVQYQIRQRGEGVP